MKIVFFGTPDYVVTLLNKLHKAFVTGPGKSPIVAVVTQSPKPVGRKQIVTFSPVDKWAHERKIPTYYSSKELLENNVKADFGVVASYGEIIPTEVLRMFPHGLLNVHPSLLPKHRGASPVPASIALGEKETGVSIIKLDEKMDHGPLVSQFKEVINEEDTTDVLRNRLFERSGDVLVELIDPYIKGKIKLKAQDDTQATFTRQVKKEHSFIPQAYLESALEGKELKEDWDLGFIKNTSINPTPTFINSFIKAMHSWPMAWTNVEINGNKKRLILLNSHLEENKLKLDNVQLEGKNEVSWDQFLIGYPGVKLS